ncbi:MAG: hypothetical protein PHO92_05370 [Candidatus Peribacteraceae bacterium]|nr:hypothetical protein [Candidatus Peribacteraceae bacterium]
MEAEARKGRRDPEKEKFWRERIREQGGTGKSVRQFCVEKGLKENLFYGWRRELKLRDGETAGAGGFVELLRAGTCHAISGVSLCVDGRLNIVVERGFDVETLKAVLACLCARGCAR